MNNILVKVIWSQKRHKGISCVPGCNILKYVTICVYNILPKNAYPVANYEEKLDKFKMRDSIKHSNNDKVVNKKVWRSISS